MAKLIVSDGFQFNPNEFESVFENLDGTTVKAEDNLWKVTFSQGQAFVRGHDFTYDDNDTSSDISDDIIDSGGITSFSFNQPSPGMGQPGFAIVRIRNLDDLSGAQVHDALESNDSEDAFAVLRTAFKGDDVLKGADQGDALLGFKGDDDIRGYGGSDELVGGTGDDRLNGGSGADILFGGHGKDKLYAGGDADGDIFYFNSGDSGKTAGSADRIYDFHNGGEDSINLAGTGGSKAITTIEHHDGNSYVTVDAHDGQDKLVIVVIDNANVHKSDISFEFMTG